MTRNKGLRQPTVPWTKEEDDFIKARYGKASARVIAADLPGRSRSAVVGRADRLGLVGIKMTYPPKKPRKPKPGKVVNLRKWNSQLPPQDKVKAPVEEVCLDLADLECKPVLVCECRDDQCSWPLDQNGYCCGLPRMASMARSGRRIAPPYCASHYHASITPLKARRTP